MRVGMWAAACVAALLTACGGGGGGGDDAGSGVSNTSNVSLTASGTPDPVPGGGAARISINLRNTGAAAATDVAVALHLDARLALSSATCTPEGGAVCPKTTDGVTMQIPGLPANSALTIDLEVTVPAGATGAMTASPAVTAGNDRLNTDNSGIATITAYSADLIVTGSGPAAPVAAGSSLNYTMTVTNAGPDAARDVSIVNTLGNFQSLGAVSCSASGGAVCPQITGGTMTVPLLPKNGTLTFTVPATVAQGISGSIADVMSVSAAGDPQPGNNAAAVQAAAFVAAVPGQTSISLQSDGGDYIGQGGVYSYTQANAQLSANVSAGHLSVQVTGDQNWYGDFQLPSAFTQFQPGTYANLKRYPFHDAAAGGLSWYGEGRGCNTLQGSFTVNSATYSGGQLTSIDISFEQHCEGSAAALRGQLRWYASDATTAPGPVNPPPAGLWAPAAGSTPATGSYIYLASGAGDYIGGGASYTYTNANAVLRVSASGGHVSVSVNGNQSWHADFQAMNTVTQLKPGYYGDLQRYPFHNPVKGGLDWSGEGRGCNTLTGWFVVDSVGFTGGMLTSLDLRFEQHCEGGAPALHGKIHWDASDATAPAGPVNPPPAGLWSPAPGATPAAGNYVYLVSDAGDYVGAGRTYTYTQANAVLGVSVNGATARVSIDGNEWWSGDFQAMTGVSPLQAGYYGGLQRYPFHNPAKGGLDWGGDGRGCNTLTGWFVVDSITFNNGTLAALDLRFEQHCEGAGPALRGKIHWVAGDTTAPAGPMNPPPGGLWAPPAGATPASGNYVYLASDGGDYIGAGQTYLYQSATNSITVGGGTGRATVGVAGWMGEFQAMRGQAQLQPGYYGNLQRYPFHNPTMGGLSWSGQGRGCNTLSGWFVVDSVTYSNGALTALDLRFEQHCEGGSPALRGKVHWSSG